MVTQARGDVTAQGPLGGEYVTVAVHDILAPGTSIRIGNSVTPPGGLPVYPSLGLAFADGTDARFDASADSSEGKSIKLGESGVDGTVSSFMVDARNYASSVADGHREYLQVAIQDQMVARGLDVATGGASRWGWWAYQGLNRLTRYVVRKAGNWLFSSSELAQAALPAGGADSAGLNGSLALLGDGGVALSNRGGPVQLSDGNRTATLPGGTGITVEPGDSGAISLPASLPYAAGAPAPILLAPPGGSTLSSELPSIGVSYPAGYESAVDPTSLILRVNGELVEPAPVGSGPAATWHVPPERSLMEGLNRVKAAVATGSGVWSEAVAEYTATGAPSQPRYLELYPGRTTVTLRWGAVRERDLAGYRVYRAPATGNSFSQISTGLVPTPAFVDSAPPAGGGLYRVTAVDKLGHESLPSAALRGFLNPQATTPAPPAVTGGQATAGDHQAGLTWDAAGQALVWRLQRAEAAGGPFADVPGAGALLAANHYVDPNVYNGHTYWYRLSALGYDGQASSPVTLGPVSPSDVAPAAPQGLTARRSGETVLLDWNPAPEADVTGYYVYRALAGGAFSRLTTSPVRATTLTDLISRDQIVGWQVSAVDAAGHEGAHSATVVVSAQRADARYVLSIAPATGGTVLLNPNTGPIYSYNTNVTLTAQPDDGFTFACWMGDLAGTQSPLTLVIRQDVTGGALFAPIGVAGALPATTLAGSGSMGFANGQGTNAKFFNPSGVALDLQGNLYIADAGNHRIRKVTPAGVVSTFAGSGTMGWQDGPADQARFNQPLAVAVDGNGNVYVADSENHRIRKISSAGQVSTLAGSGIPTLINGQGQAAAFQRPGGIAVDNRGNVYVGDTGNNSVRMISPSAMVSTLAGNMAGGYVDGPTAGARFLRPAGVAVEPGGGLVYVADSGNSRIRKIAGGMVSTLAGSGAEESRDGMGQAAAFANPQGLGLGAGSVLYVTDYAAHRIRRLGPGGQVTTLSGATLGYQDGAIALFDYPRGVAAGPDGDVFVADQGNHVIRRIRTAQQTILPPTGGVITYTTTTRLVTVSFPAGALAGETTITTALADATGLPSGLAPVGGAFAIRAQDGAGAPVTAFPLPLKLEVALGAPEVAGLSPEAPAQLALYYSSENATTWTQATSVFDQGGLRLTASLTHLSRFVITTGESNALPVHEWLPLLLR